MNYKEVFQLAQDKGYKLHFEWDNPSIRNYKVASDFTAIDDDIISNNPVQCYLELTLIQKLLRDEHKIWVWVNPTDYNTEPRSIIYEFYIDDFSERTDSQGGFPTYQQALLEGIHEALKLLP